MDEKTKIIVLKRPIKRCPHCGGECSLEFLVNETYYVKCSECSTTNLRLSAHTGAVTGYDNANDAVDHWNKRIREVSVPDCKYCEENDGNEDCPFYGEPDGCNNRSLGAKVLNGEHAVQNKKIYYPCSKCKNRVDNLQIPFDEYGREIYGCLKDCSMKRPEDFKDGKCERFEEGYSNMCWP